MQGVGQALLGVAVQGQTGNRSREPSVQRIAPLAQPVGARGQPALCQLSRRAEPGDMRHVLGARPQALLVPGAKLDRGDWGSGADVERPDPLGA